MNETDLLWDLERRFWLEGEGHYRAALDPHCVMVFGFGSLTGEAILESLEAAPRWNAVAMAERRLARPTDDLAVLAYLAAGRREGEPAYEAWCSSTYRRDGPRWRLVQHQQTPA
ncbi:nuclear transport factor 2 family protein [Phenylobacterium sp. VNQ135]|uniref:nuclear transport factor 2 family protein n=1 Tax=Phenylobacterium sp. VNQ135 TaxID=3400922 RepID=UPI003BFD25E1